jgi:hypothetical protein
VTEVSREQIGLRYCLSPHKVIRVTRNDINYHGDPMNTKNAYANPHGFANNILKMTHVNTLIVSRISALPVLAPVFNNVLLFYNMIAYRE